jgi:hypothetical protein
MYLKKILLIAVIPLLLTGCSIYKDFKIANIGTDFDKSSKAYLNLLRWQEYESALTTYVSVPLQEEYRKKIKEVGEARIFDFRVKKQECDPARGDATVTAELDYYRPPSVTVKTVVDNQKWSYEGENEKRFWRLKTLLPDFK